MHPTAVFATATSRLHADILIIRLLRAGIAREKISAIFPERLTPNCALCWLDGRSAPADYDGEPIRIAGPLSKVITTPNQTSLPRSLFQIGLSYSDAATSAEKLGQGKILLCVHTSNEDEVAITWHTCCDLEAESLAIAIPVKAAPSPAPTRRKWLAPHEKVVRMPSRRTRAPALALAI